MGFLGSGDHQYYRLLIGWASKIHSSFPTYPQQKKIFVPHAIYDIMPGIAFYKKLNWPYEKYANV